MMENERGRAGKMKELTHEEKVAAVDKIARTALTELSVEAIANLRECCYDALGDLASKTLTLEKILAQAEQGERFEDYLLSVRVIIDQYYTGTHSVQAHRHVKEAEELISKIGEIVRKALEPETPKFCAMIARRRLAGTPIIESLEALEAANVVCQDQTNFGGYCTIQAAPCQYQPTR